MHRLQWAVRQPGALRVAVLLTACVVLFLTKSFSAEKSVSDTIGNLLSVDRIMRYAFIFRDTAKHALPVTILAIDDETYLEWGEPLLTPRARLQALIEMVAPTQPAAIVVDIALELRDPDAAGERALRDYLKNYRGPPIVIARGLRRPDGKEWIFRPTSYDEAIDANPDVYAGSALFDIDPDFVVRRWRLWEHACGQDPVASITSMQLLVATLVKQGPKAAQRLELDLAANAPTGCAAGHDNSATLDAIRGILGHPLADDRRGRMTYYFGGAQSAHNMLAQGLAAASTGTVPLVKQVSAKYAPDGSRYADDAFANRVVIIGNTHGDSGDMHITPFGRMQGVLVVANAVSSAGTALTARILVWPWSAAAAVTLFVTFALIFIAFRMFMAFVACFVVGLLFVLAAEHLLGVTNAFDIAADAISMFIIFQVLRFVFVDLLDDVLNVRWYALLRGKPQQADDAGGR